MPKSLGDTSFINLFPSFVYDKDQVAEKSLDIWNAYRIRVLNESSNDTAFLFHQLTQTDNYVNLALQYYQEPKLWWLIPLVNEAEDPFVFLDEVRGEDQPIIKILKPQFIGGLVYDITTAREFAQSLYNKNGDGF